MKRYSTRLFSIITSFSLLGLVLAFALPLQSNLAEGAGRPLITGRPDDPGAQTGTHLTDAKLRACQNRQNAINNIMARIVNRGTKQIATFDAIATRTEVFYQKQGKTLSNYDDLVAGVAAAKTKAEANLATMKSDDSFSCASNNPKGIVEAFQSDLKQEIADLKAYRTAVKNLIVGVKSVQGTTSSGTTQGATE